MSIKRLCFGAALAALLSCCQWQSDNALQANWKAYQARFVSEDGRVLDTGNGNISHSEGQGYGMIIAVKLNDPETFARIWQWTSNNLQVREDGLFMWRRRPGTALADEDKNNASDGDIIIAWALLEAASQWQQPEYEQEAVKILDAIKHKLIVRKDGLTLLLPGEYGFQSQAGVTLNLSYWVYPAFKVFAAKQQGPVWDDLAASGQTLLQQARYGRWQLPPDWLQLSDGPTLTPAKTARFGYDAVRVPLYLAFAGIDNELLTAFANYWSYYQGYVPAWIDLQTSSMDADGASAGINAVKQLTLATVNKTRSMTFKTIDATQDYYSATLLLLSQLAYRQSLAQR